MLIRASFLAVGRAREPREEVGRITHFRFVQRPRQRRHGFGRQRRIEAADRQRQIPSHPRIVVLGALEGLDQRRRQRPVGAHLRIGHQPRQLVRRRPPPVGARRPDLGQVVLRASGRRPAATGSPTYTSTVTPTTANGIRKN